MFSVFCVPSWISLYTHMISRLEETFREREHRERSFLVAFRRPEDWESNREQSGNTAVIAASDSAIPSEIPAARDSVPSQANEGIGRRGSCPSGSRAHVAFVDIVPEPR